MDMSWGNNLPFHGNQNTTMMSNQVNTSQGYAYGGFFQDKSLSTLNQVHQQNPNDPLINWGKSMVHSVNGYSPGGVSGSFNPYADAGYYIYHSDQSVLPTAQNTFNTVSNTRHYQGHNYNSIMSTFENNAQFLDSTAPTSGNFGNSLDATAHNISQFNSSPVLANYSVGGGNSFNQLMSGLGIPGW